MPDHFSGLLNTRLPQGTGEEEGKGCSEIMRMTDWKICDSICLVWEPMGGDIWEESCLAPFFFFFLAYWVWDFYIIKEDCAAGGQSMNLNFAWETASGWYNTLHPDFDFPPTCKSLEHFFLFSPAISLIFIPSFSVFVAGRFSDSQLVIYLEAALAC